ncbi:hypothetical protein SBA5_1010024 [Candidatus Sulfotelmatomonas gaucii]|uniref:Uncharacterized protein n=1 Tax=Candidatus Sulfuritelmatomonas gaucii TaxID=2043161 RepID=A0A2N9L2V7_9BACT|nr:hypothetical protein SBA5_1010024 [Candidatus Sulfotelmatomonas gaucii]
MHSASANTPPKSALQPDLGDYRRLRIAVAYDVHGYRSVIRDLSRWTEHFCSVQRKS